MLKKKWTLVGPLYRTARRENMKAILYGDWLGQLGKDRPTSTLVQLTRVVPWGRTLNGPPANALAETSLPQSAHVRTQPPVTNAILRSKLFVLPSVQDAVIVSQCLINDLTNTVVTTTNLARSNQPAHIEHTYLAQR